MPTYGYRCEGCQKEFEIWQRMSDAAEAQCPSCGAPGRRLFYPTGVVFKGSGFYKNDSRPSSSGDAGDGASKKAGAKPTTNTEKTTTGTGTPAPATTTTTATTTAAAGDS